MMWNANLDIAGLYAIDNTIFDTFVFPTTTVVDTEGASHNLAFTDEEKTNIIDMILFQSENRCVRYENPDVFKNRLEIFSKKMSNDDWEKIMYYGFFTRTFNPTENVFEITTEDTTRANGRTLTYKYSNYKEISEQTDDGKSNTEYVNYVETDEQIDARVTEAHSADVKASGGVGDGNVSVNVVQGQSDGYGSANVSLPIDEANTNNNKVTDDLGKVEHSKDGEIRVALSEGKVEKSIAGEKSEVETFAPNPDHFVRKRHGNIGVTMSGEIVLNTFNTEKELDVETRVIEDVIDELTLAVF